MPAKDMFAQRWAHLPVSALEWRQRGRWQLATMLAQKNKRRGQLPSEVNR